MNNARNNRATDQLYTAVQSAIEAGWDPRRFTLSASEAWHTVLGEQQRMDGITFQNLLTTKDAR